MYCRAAHAWGTVKIVWDTWLIKTAEAGTNAADEQQYAVPMPQNKPQQPSVPSACPAPSLPSAALDQASREAGGAATSSLLPPPQQTPAAHGQSHQQAAHDSHAPAESNLLYAPLLTPSTKHYSALAWPKNNASVQSIHLLCCCSAQL